MMDVYLTVDTEVWPRFADWRETRLARDLARDIRGVTREGEYGIGYQIRLLNEHGLKGVFLVESLFACAVGLEPLREVVALIRDGGHEAQLHLHTEWLGRIDPPLVGGRTGLNCRDFSFADQVELIRIAADNLRACGVPEVRGFRAGNYGANLDTLRALAANGIGIDTSHNTCYLDSDCGLRTPGPMLQPGWLEGVYELPIAFFEDRPGHYRHAQICAVSAREMRNALLDAWREGWASFVIVSHGFELLKDRKDPRRPARPDRIVVRRFESLCRFLGANKDKFRTAFLAETVPATRPQPARALRSGVAHTAWRMAEQLVRRVT